MNHGAFCEEPQARCTCHRLVPGEGAPFVTQDAEITHELLCTSLLCCILEALVELCHSDSCFLHKHRRVAVIIKTNWLLNVLYFTGLSKLWVACPCHSSGHCGQSFPAHQDCLFLKPSTFLFRIEVCFVILFLSSPVPFGSGFQGCAKEKCTHMDGVRVRGWLVSVGNINAESRGRNSLPDPAVWEYTGLRYSIVTVPSVPEIFCYLPMHRETLLNIFIGILLSCLYKSKPSFVKDKMGGKKEKEGGIILYASANVPNKYSI